MEVRRALGRLSLIGAIALTGCPSAHTRQTDCGEGGTFHDAGAVGRYCAYIVVEGGFRCPAGFPNRIDLEGGAVVCSDRRTTEEDLPAEVCELVGLECLGPPPPVDGGSPSDGDDDGIPTGQDCDDGDDRVGSTAERPCSTRCGPGTEACIDGEWLGCDGPQRLDPAEGSFGNLAPSSHATGEVLVAYTTEIAGQRFAYTHRFDGTDWGPAERIDGSDGAEGVRAVLGVDGRRLAAWTEFDGMTRNVWVATAPPDAGWEPPERMGGDAAWPEVTLDPSGVGVASWHANGDAMARILDPVTGWAAPTVLEAGTAAGYYPRVAPTGGGGFVAVWLQQIPTTAIGSRQYTPGSGWQAPITLALGDSIRGAPGARHAVTGDGDVFVTWAAASAVVQHRPASTGIWSGETVLQASPGGEIVSAEVVTSTAGEAVVAWSVSASPHVIWASRFVPGAGWTTPEQLASTPSLSGLSHQLAATDDGGFVAIWWSTPDVPMGMRRYTPGVGFGAEVALPPGQYPIVFEAPSGEIHVVYEVQEIMSSIICATTD